MPPLGELGGPASPKGGGKGTLKGAVQAAAKGAAQGAAKGAAKGVVQGGTKGAVQGAAKGATRGVSAGKGKGKDASTFQAALDNMTQALQEAKPANSARTAHIPFASPRSVTGSEDAGPNLERDAPGIRPDPPSPIGPNRPIRATSPQVDRPDRVVPADTRTMVPKLKLSPVTADPSAPAGAGAGAARGAQAPAVRGGSGGAVASSGIFASPRPAERRPSAPLNEEASGSAAAERPEAGSTIATRAASPAMMRPIKPLEEGTRDGERGILQQPPREAGERRIFQTPLVRTGVVEPMSPTAQSITGPGTAQGVTPRAPAPKLPIEPREQPKQETSRSSLRRAGTGGLATGQSVKSIASKGNLAGGESFKSTASARTGAGTITASGFVATPMSGFSLDDSDSDEDFDDMVEEELDEHEEQRLNEQMEDIEEGEDYFVDTRLLTDLLREDAAATERGKKKTELSEALTFYVKHTHRLQKAKHRQKASDIDVLTPFITQTDFGILVKEQKTLSDANKWFKFDAFFGSLIVANGMILGITAESSGEEPVWQELLGLAFFVIFVGEFIWRLKRNDMLNSKFKQVFDPRIDGWATFDFIVLSFTFLDIAISTGTDLLKMDTAFGLEFLSVVRLTRLLRILRLLRLARNLRDLYLFIVSMAEARMLLIWSIFLLVVMSALFGLVFADMIDPIHLQGPRTRPASEELRLQRPEAPPMSTYWGGIPQTFVSMLEIATFGGIHLTEEILWHAKSTIIAAICLFIFIGVVSFGILNMMLGTLITTTIKKCTEIVRLEEIVAILLRHKALKGARKELRRLIRKDFENKSKGSAIRDVAILTREHALKWSEEAADPGHEGGWYAAVQRDLEEFRKMCSMCCKRKQEETKASIPSVFKQAGIDPEHIITIFDLVGEATGDDAPMLQVNEFMQYCIWMLDLASPVEQAGRDFYFRMLYRKVCVIVDQLASTSGQLREMEYLLLPLLEKQRVNNLKFDDNAMNTAHEEDEAEKKAAAELEARLHGGLETEEDKHHREAEEEMKTLLHASASTLETALAEEEQAEAKGEADILDTLVFMQPGQVPWKHQKVASDGGLQNDQEGNFLSNEEMVEEKAKEALEEARREYEKETERQDKVAKRRTNQLGKLDVFSIGTVVINCIFIGIQVTEGGEHRALLDDDFGTMDMIWILIEVALTAAYIVEFYLRVATIYQLDVKNDPVFVFKVVPRICQKPTYGMLWELCLHVEKICRHDAFFVIDLVNVIVSVFNFIVFEIIPAEGSTTARVWLPLFSVYRVLRLFRLVYLVPHLKVLLMALIQSRRMLFWSVTLLALSAYFISVALIFMVKYQLGEERVPIFDDLFGSIPQAVQTTFEVITFSNWGRRILLAMEEQWWLIAIIIPMIVFGGFGMLNLIIGVMVQVAFQIKAAEQVDTGKKFDRFLKSDIEDATSRAFVKITDQIRKDTDPLKHMLWDLCEEAEQLKERKMDLKVSLEEAAEKGDKWFSDMVKDVDEEPFLPLTQESDQTGENADGQVNSTNRKLFFEGERVLDSRNSVAVLDSVWLAPSAVAVRFRATLDHEKGPVSQAVDPWQSELSYRGGGCGGGGGRKSPLMYLTQGEARKLFNDGIMEGEERPVDENNPDQYFYEVGVCYDGLLLFSGITPGAKGFNFRFSHNFASISLLPIELVDQSSAEDEDKESAYYTMGEIHQGTEFEVISTGHSDIDLTIGDIGKVTACKRMANEEKATFSIEWDRKKETTNHVGRADLKHFKVIESQKWQECVTRKPNVGDIVVKTKFEVTKRSHDTSYSLNPGQPAVVVQVDSDHDMKLRCGDGNLTGFLPPKQFSYCKDPTPLGAFLVSPFLDADVHDQTKTDAFWKPHEGTQRGRSEKVTVYPMMTNTIVNVIGNAGARLDEYLLEKVEEGLFTYERFEDFKAKPDYQVDDKDASPPAFRIFVSTLADLLPPAVREAPGQESMFPLAWSDGLEEVVEWFSEDPMDSLLTLADLDGDGALSHEEVDSAMAKRLIPESVSFEAMDKNHDGKVTMKELRKAVDSQKDALTEFSKGFLRRLDPKMRLQTAQEARKDHELQELLHAPIFVVATPGEVQAPMQWRILANAKIFKQDGTDDHIALKALLNSARLLQLEKANAALIKNCGAKLKGFGIHPEDDDDVDFKFAGDVDEEGIHKQFVKIQVHSKPEWALVGELEGREVVMDADDVKIHLHEGRASSGWCPCFKGDNKVFRIPRGTRGEVVSFALRPGPEKAQSQEGEGDALEATHLTQSGSSEILGGASSASFKPTLRRSGSSLGRLLTPLSSGSKPGTPSHSVNTVGGIRELRVRWHLPKFPKEGKPVRSDYLDFMMHPQEDHGGPTRKGSKRGRDSANKPSTPTSAPEVKWVVHVEVPQVSCTGSREARHTRSQEMEAQLEKVRALDRDVVDMRVMNELLKDPQFQKALRKYSMGAEKLLIGYENLDVLGTGEVMRDDFVEAMVRLRSVSEFDLCKMRTYMRNCRQEMKEVKNIAKAESSTFTNVLRSLRAVEVDKNSLENRSQTNREKTKKAKEAAEALKAKQRASEQELEQANQRLRGQFERLRRHVDEMGPKIKEHGHLPMRLQLVKAGQDYQDFTKLYEEMDKEDEEGKSFGIGREEDNWKAAGYQ